jgi:type I restriction enzyme S subunit
MARAKKETALTPEERLQAALVPDWEWPYKLPENWCWVRLYSLAHIISKGTTPKGGKDAYVEKGIRFLRIENINEDGSISHENIKHITEEMHTGFLRRSILCKDDILISIAGTLGKTGIVGEADLPLNTNQAISFVRLIRGNLLPQYIKMSIDNPKTQDMLISQAKVTSIPNLTLEIIGNCAIPLAPLAEQQRIVDRIESLFAKLDEAKEKAQAVVDSFETRKAAILYKAFTGELTAKWREEHGVSIDNWKTTRFDSVAAIRSNLVDPAEYQSFPHIAPDNIEKKTGVLLEYHTIAEDGVTSGKHRFYSGQILYSKIRPYLSKAVVVDFDGLCSADMYPIEAYQNARCLWYYMLSDEFLLQASTAGSRSVLPKINQKELSALTVHLPTNDREQEEIARILDELFDKEQQTKEAAEIVLDQIKLMKKSILARAFRGELGTNDPSEESAVELLRQVIEQEDGDVVRPKAKAKRIAIPAEIKPLLSGANEEAIVKLLLKAAPQSVSTQTVMSISKKKFELMDALRNLEKKQIVSKSDSGEYSLVR